MALLVSTLTAETVQAALRWSREALQPSPTASLDAQLLLGHVLERSRPWLLAHGDERLTPAQRGAYAELIHRRAEGEPVAYLRGYVEWCDLEIQVTKDVLIPRPETELLVERAIALTTKGSARALADIGTGSGAIAIQLARSLDGVRVYGVDASTAALTVAASNVARYRLEDRVTLLLGNLLEPLPEPPDLLVANLPYLSNKMMEELPSDVRHEPEQALCGGPHGLELYREMFAQMAARGWSVPMALEIDPRQAASMRSLLTRYFPTAGIEIAADYAGLDRIVTCQPDSQAAC